MPKSRKDLSPRSDPDRVQEALLLVGTPYVYKSVDPNIGFDCVSCVRFLGRRLGVVFPQIEMPEYQDIDKFNLAEILTYFSKIGFRQVEAWSPLDVVLLIGPRYHVGLMLDDEGRFFHCTEDHGTEISSINRSPWKKNLKFFFRMR